MAPLISLVIPVYRNAANIPPLLAALGELRSELGESLEVVLVVDGSPDDSAAQLRRSLPSSGLDARLLELSRNFGSFAAIRAGLAAGRGDFFAVMAADLQEPPELVAEFYRRLAGGEVDIALGRREGREDGADGLAAGLFWFLYRKLVLPEVPPGGIDVFACTRAVRDQLLALEERHSSLVALLLWVGYRRELVPYKRRRREVGKSAWTFRRKLAYLSDSVYSFSDLPIRWLVRAGALGLACSLLLSLFVIFARISGLIEVPGYAATVVLVMFFGGLNSFGLGVIGNYVWRTYENTKSRPNFIVARQQDYRPAAPVAGGEP
jgi:glycosyltransferase involved in cell wall biosynthesis